MALRSGRGDSVLTGVVAPLAKDLPPLNPNCGVTILKYDLSRVSRMACQDGSSGPLSIAIHAPLKEVPSRPPLVPLSLSLLLWARRVLARNE